MNKHLLIAVAVIGLIGLATADYAYAKGWGGRCGAGLARIKPSFSPSSLPATSGESATADNPFATVKELKDAAQKGHVSVLYVFDSGAGSQRAKFESTLFANEDVGVALKVFRKVGIDVARDQVARDMFGQKVPSFVTFDAKGEKSGELSMAGYKAKAGDVLKLLNRAAKGHGKMPLKTFVKKYRSFLNELDQIEGKKSTCVQKRARLEASGKAAKIAKVEKEEKAIAKREAKILDGEKKLLAAVKAYDADPDANKRGGARPAAKKPSPPAGGGWG